MKSRYIATLKLRKAGVPSQHFTMALGRFDDVETAYRYAQNSYGELDGHEVVSVRAETNFEVKLHELSRTLIRTIRVACGSAIALFAYVWAHDSWVDTGDIPLGSLTGNMITSNLFHFGVALFVCWLCWELAFGEGPKD